jgi:hypothetical protein
VGTKKYVEKSQKVIFIEKIPQDDGAKPLLVERQAKVLEVYNGVIFVKDEKGLKQEKVVEEVDIVDLEVDFKFADLKDLHWSAFQKSPERKLVVLGVYPGKEANQYFVKE